MTSNDKIADGKGLSWKYKAFKEEKKALIVIASNCHMTVFQAQKRCSHSQLVAVCRAEAPVLVVADLSGRVVTVRAAPAEVSERDVVALDARALVLDDDWKLRLDGLI